MQLERLSQRQACCAVSSIRSSLPTTLCHYSPALASTRYSDTPFQPFPLVINAYRSVVAVSKADRNPRT